LRRSPTFATALFPRFNNATDEKFSPFPLFLPVEAATKKARREIALSVGLEHSLKRGDVIHCRRYAQRSH